MFAPLALKTLPCLLGEPAQLAERPALLLNWAGDQTTSLEVAPYDISPRAMLAAGHRVLSFDMPCHGAREVPNQPAEVAGFLANLSAGHDVFAEFVSQGMQVIDELIARGLAEPGRVLVSGTSRGAYCAMRLMAADERIAAGAAFAPAIDWRTVREFASHRQDPAVADLDLTKWAAAFVDRPLFAVIGNRDERVGTDNFLRFVSAIVAAEAAAGLSHSRLEAHLITVAGHTLTDAWRQAGADFLVQIAAGSGTGPQP